MRGKPGGLFRRSGLRLTSGGGLFFFALFFFFAPPAAFARRLVRRDGELGAPQPSLQRRHRFFHRGVLRRERLVFVAVRVRRRLRLLRQSREPSHHRRRALDVASGRAPHLLHGGRLRTRRGVQLDSKRLRFFVCSFNR